MKAFKINMYILLIGVFAPISILYCQNPNWLVNSANYPLDASVIAEIKINNQISTDINDKVAAFDAKGKIRGVANVTFVKSLNKYLVFLTVLSEVSGDKLTFKVYDASKDKVFIATNEAITFEPNKIFGSNDTPFQIISKGSLGVNNNLITKLSIHPNPVKDIIFFTSDKRFTQVKIYSVLGKEVYSKPLESSAVSLKLGNLDSGMYLIKLFMGNSSIITKRIVKL